MTGYNHHTAMSTTEVAGSTDPTALVTTFLALKRLLASHPMPFYELVCIARDPNHVIFGDAARVLITFALLQSDGKMHSSTRSSIKACVKGEGRHMTLTHPNVEERET